MSDGNESAIYEERIRQIAPEVAINFSPAQSRGFDYENHAHPNRNSVRGIPQSSSRIDFSVRWRFREEIYFISVCCSDFTSQRPFRLTKVSVTRARKVRPSLSVRC